MLNSMISAAHNFVIVNNIGFVKSAVNIAVCVWKGESPLTMGPNSKQVKGFVVRLILGDRRIWK